MQNFVFRLNEQLNKQSSCWWSAMPWRSCNVTAMILIWFHNTRLTQYDYIYRQCLVYPNPIIQNWSHISKHSRIKDSKCWKCLKRRRRRGGGRLVKTRLEVNGKECCIVELELEHYLNQCWLIISKVLWHSSEDIIIRRFEDTNQ